VTTEPALPPTSLHPAPTIPTARPQPDAGMPSARNLDSSVALGDGKTQMLETSRPKSARMSVCQRSTAASAAARKTATEKAKGGTGFTLGQQLHTDKRIEGSAPKPGAKERSATEKARDFAGLQSSTAASAGRAQAARKAAACESDGVVFDKSKRQSFMPESRKMNVSAQAHGESGKQSEIGRKTFASRDHASTVFSGEDAPKQRALRAPGKQEAATLPPSVKSEAEAKVYQAMTSSSDVSQVQRANNRKHMHASSIFSSDPENVSSNLSRPTTASSNKTASSIFSGGAFADDAAKSTQSSRPALNVSGATLAAGAGGGGLPSARASAQAALRGNGGLW